MEARGARQTKSRGREVIRTAEGNIGNSLLIPSFFFFSVESEEELLGAEFLGVCRGRYEIFSSYVVRRGML